MLAATWGQHLLTVVGRACGSNEVAPIKNQHLPKPWQYNCW
jgi:hypothetical protein